VIAPVMPPAPDSGGELSTPDPDILPRLRLLGVLTHGKIDVGLLSLSGCASRKKRMKIRYMCETLEVAGKNNMHVVVQLYDDLHLQHTQEVGLGCGRTGGLGRTERCTCAEPSISRAAAATGVT
jgi:hypothetical protein